MRPEPVALTGRGHWLWDQGCEGQAFLLGREEGGHPERDQLGETCSVCLFVALVVHPSLGSAPGDGNGSRDQADGKEVAVFAPSLPGSCFAAAP